MSRTIFLALTCCALLNGCATNYVVKVDSIATTYSPGGKYFLSSGMSDVKESDLYFREFSEYFRRILAHKGYAETDNRAEAEIEMSFSYGTSSGRQEFYTYTRPLYQLSGGERISYKEIKTDSNGNKTETTGTYFLPLRAQVAGYSSELNSHTVYTHFATLEAQKKEPPGTERKTIWKTTLRSTNPSNDLRLLLPYMAAAGEPYLGTNTGAVRTITIDADSLRLNDLQPTPPP